MKRRYLFLFLFVTALLAFGIIWILHITAENKIQKENPFIRSFPPHLLKPDKQIDLKFNSYYFAGEDTNTIYLGNSMAPLHALAIDTSFEKLNEIKIQPEKSNFKFRAVQLRVLPPHFFLFDGNVPCIYGGNTIEWNAKLLQKDIPYFTLAEPMDSLSFIFRTNLPVTGENILGTLQLNKPEDFNFFGNLIEKQTNGDGIFDTDGTLLFNRETERLIYIYRYRNRFLEADKSGHLISLGKTIDTVSHAHIKVARTKDGISMAAPPLPVNITAATYKQLLFINSAQRGKYENEKAWKMYSTIDVYDLKQGRYLFSFYLTGSKGKKLRKLHITSQNLYAIFDSELIKYSYQNALKKVIEK